MPTPIPIPPHGTPFIDPKTGKIHLLWQNYLLALEQSVVINAAPIDARYWTSSTNAQLPNEQNLGLLLTGHLSITTALGVATPSTSTTIPAADLSGQVSLLHGGTAADLSATGGTSQVLKQAGVGVPVTVGQLASTDISGIASGTYTPTLTGVANVAASTAYVTNYLRIGSIVVFGGQVDVDPTLAATATQLGISLPIASNFAGQNQCGGAANAPAVGGLSGAVYADPANDRAELGFVTGADVANRAWLFTATYLIV